MTTLGTLKTQIANDLRRSNLATEIGEAISEAIEFYQSKRFYFNENRDATFATVAGQVWYGAADDADIPLLLDADGLYVTVGGDRRTLDWMSPAAFEDVTDDSAANGQPYAYTRYAERIGVYPKPDQAYTVRLTGLLKFDEPATDDEADNVWMTEAYHLIRCRAKAELYRHVIRSNERFLAMKDAEREAFTSLSGKTSRQIGTGRVVPMQF